MDLKSKMQDAIDNLDHKQVAWIHKSDVIDLRDKAVILHQSLEHTDEADKGIVEESATTFLTQTEEVISKINSGEYKC